MPYIINIDRVNKSSNHSHYGKVVSSNLCAEIVQYHDENTTANCSLGAVCVDEGLNLYVNFKEAYWNRIKNSVKTLVYSLNNVIQQNKYSTARAKKGGLEQKAIAIGMVGFADALVQLNMAYDSPEAVKFGRELQARIYYYAIEASCEYSQAYRKYNDGLRVTYRSEGDDSVYSGFEQSNYAKGMLEFDHFDYTPVDLDWDALRAKMTQGMYNSLLIANMPTASTSFLLGKVECFEPFTNNIYERENLVGKFVTMNKHLNKILSYIKSESDRKAFVYEMISQGGSVQNIDWTGFGFTKLQEENYKPLFKTVWEISQKAVIEHAAARQYYVDQSQSMNLFLKDPDLSKLSSMLVASYKANLKTGVYYLRTKAATETNKSLGLQRSVVRGASSNSNDITCIGCTV
jgi:ribonucleoside-diphosphate reductase alpha chain